MKQTDAKRGEVVINALSEDITLRTFRVGSDKKNFEIIKSVPMTEKEIAKKLKLTTMPANRRINELVEAKIVAREKMGGDIQLTQLGKNFLNYIENLKKEIISSMVDLI